VKKKEAIWGMILSLCLLFIFASPVFAGGLTVSGGKIDSSISQSKDYSYTMTVSNTSEEPMDIGVEVKGYGMSANNDFVVLESKDDNSPFTVRELLTASPGSFHLEPGNSQVVTVVAKIPSGIGDGGRYAIVFIHTVPKGGMVATISAVAARVLLTIDGSKLIHNSEITTLEKINGELGLLVTVANKGNHHYKPNIKGFIKKGSKILAAGSFESAWPLIPGYSRQYKLVLTNNETLPPDSYEAIIEVKDDSGNLVAQYNSSFNIGETFTPVATSAPPVTPAVQASPTPLTSETISPANSALLELKDKGISISFPKGAVLAPVEVSLRSYPPEQLPSAPEGYLLTSNCFRVDGLTGLLSNEALVTVKYTSVDLEKAKGDASTLRLARWDEAKSQWTVLDTSLDKSVLTLSASTNQFSIWAVMVAPPAGINWFIIGGIAAGGLILAAVLVFFIMKRRSG
jgi:hypothetical protein